MATQGSSTVLRQLHRRILEARANSDRLFQILREDAFYDRPIAERHRIIFYLGHLEAFDWNLFREQLFASNSSPSKLDQLFAFGIDPVDGGLPTDQAADWPSLPEVRQYVQSLRTRIDDALDAGEFFKLPPANREAAETLLHVAIEHRLMHAETLAYMFHQLPYERKIPQTQPATALATVENELVEIPAGKATLGLPRNASSPFGWDNEFESLTLSVPGVSHQPLHGHQQRISALP